MLWPAEVLFYTLAVLPGTDVKLQWVFCSRNSECHFRYITSLHTEFWKKLSGRLHCCYAAVALWSSDLSIAATSCLTDQAKCNQIYGVIKCRFLAEMSPALPSARNSGGLVAFLRYNWSCFLHILKRLYLNVVSRGSSVGRVIGCWLGDRSLI